MKERGDGRGSLQYPFCAPFFCKQSLTVNERGETKKKMRNDAGGGTIGFMLYLDSLEILFISLYLISS